MYFRGREAEVKTKLSSQISLKHRDQSFKIIEDIIKVSLFVAVCLICKGLGEVTI